MSSEKYHPLSSMLRRSSRIATKYGPVYSNLPSVTSQRRAARIKDVFALSKVLKAALRDEGKKSANPLQFIGAGGIHFNSVWASNRYVPEPVSGETYSRVRITISYENHTGPCDEPNLWRTDREEFVELHFKPFTAMDKRKPLTKSWTETVRGHEECGAMIRYTVQSIDQIVLEGIAVDSEMSDSASESSSESSSESFVCM
jgi:hypothetical protein